MGSPCILAYSLVLQQSQLPSTDGLASVVTSAASHGCSLPSPSVFPHGRDGIVLTIRVRNRKGALRQGNSANCKIQACFVRRGSRFGSDNMQALPLTRLASIVCRLIFSLLCVVTIFIAYVGYVVYYQRLAAAVSGQCN